MSKIEGLVEKTLSKTPISAKDLVKKINLNQEKVKTTKQIVNSILYNLLKVEKVIRLEGTPPLWIENSTLSAAQRSEDGGAEDSIQTLIFIDTTNSPCHRQAMAYANHDCLIWLYSKEQASLTIEENEHVKLQPLLQSNESISTAMILDIALFQGYHWGGNKLFFHIIIVSKSSSFQGFDKMFKQRMNDYEYQVDVITDGWDSLKLLLE